MTSPLLRFLFGGPPADRVLATDTVIRCPSCKSDRAMASTLILRRFVIRQGRVHNFEDGDRLLCEECGCLFSVDSHGIFRQHAHRPVAAAAPPEAAEDPPRRLLQIPLERPRV